MAAQKLQNFTFRDIETGRDAPNLLIGVSDGWDSSVMSKQGFRVSPFYWSGSPAEAVEPSALCLRLVQLSLIPA